jgi:hypothetical protein
VNTEPIHRRISQTGPWHATPEDYRRYKLEGFYHVSAEYVNEQLKRQKDCCAICERPFAEMSDRRRPSIDHDHSCCSGATSCGKCVRGLLCCRCNTMLGFIESIGFLTWFTRAQKYLTKWKLVQRRRKNGTEQSVPIY